jgi:hypothetical protein
MLVAAAVVCREGVSIVKSKRLGSIVGVVLATIAFSGHTPSKADTVLDQQYLLNDGTPGAGFSNSGFRRAETFTVGVTGTLSEVDIFLPGLGPSSSFTGMNILAVGSDGVPSLAAPLAFSNSFTLTGNVASFAFSLPVTAGEALAIEPLALAALWLKNTVETCTPIIPTINDWSTTSRPSWMFQHHLLVLVFPA